MEKSLDRFRHEFDKYFCAVKGMSCGSLASIDGDGISVHFDMSNEETVTLRSSAGFYELARYACGSPKLSRLYPQPLRDIAGRFGAEWVENDADGHSGLKMTFDRNTLPLSVGYTRMLQAMTLIGNLDRHAL
ncbi:MAG: hypothetical protein IJY04_02560 [Clostridia bacterium]|nr:hypothetical protein [Clostridia bacterium]